MFTCRSINLFLRTNRGVLERDGLSDLLKWLLDAEWAKHGVDLTATFRELVRMIQGTRERRLDSLYVATEHIEGAAAEIEKVVLSRSFPRHDGVERSWDKRVIEEIKVEKLDVFYFLILRKLSPSAMLAKALADVESPEDEYCPCIRLAARFLATDFVHRSVWGFTGFPEITTPRRHGRSSTRLPHCVRPSSR